LITTISFLSSTFTYTLPSIAPYPIGGFFQPGFHVLAPQPVVLRPYSVKSLETVNPQISAPGTRLNTSSRIQAYPLLSFELLGRHRLAPGNVNIQPYSIKTLQNAFTLGTHYLSNYGFTISVDDLNV
jgi:hypothetical protein